MATCHDTRHASWIEDVDTDDTIAVISGRIEQGRIVHRSEWVLTVEYGSSVMYRLMGGRLSSKWFPMTVTLSVVRSLRDRIEIDAVAEDTTGRYLGDTSMRRGEPSISEKAFLEQFDRVCCELGATAPVAV